MDGATQIGLGTVSAGVATFTTSTLSSANHAITAVYSGDASYGPASSGVLSEKVVDFTIASVGSGAATVPATGVASYPIALTPVGGSAMPGTIAFTVTGISLGSTVSFSPATLSAGAGASTITLNIQLPGKAALDKPARPFKGSALPLALCLVLLPFARRLRKVARRWRELAVVALLGVALVVGLNGCGGPKIKAQSYSLTVTAASGALSHTLPLKLTVQ
jgi:hypothetical protein